MSLKSLRWDESYDRHHTDRQVGEAVFDLVLRGGRVVDGTGGPASRADVGVTGGRVAAVGRLDAAGSADVIDATGRLVYPGFIDTHSHADALVASDEVQLAVLRQGVTTLVLGQDGLSYAPSTPATLAFVSRYFAAINGTHPLLDTGRGASVGELLATFTGRTAVNTAYLVPAGTVRHNVLRGAARPAGPDELAAMRAWVEQGLADGAVGLSTGLEYLPGRYAGAAELAELCRPVAAAGLPYVSHLRGYGAAVDAGLAEAREIATTAGVAAHVSHLHGPESRTLSIVDGIRSAGIDLTFDTYPYRRGCTILAMAALPRWLDDTDLDRTVDALGDPGVRSRVLDATSADLWPRITFAHVPDPQWNWTEGRTLSDVAASVDREPGDVLLDVLVATRLAASGVVQRLPGADSVRALLRHPAHVGGSDGIYVAGHAHPRGWGTFARFLGRHVRELADWTWEQAAVHLASRPASRFGLTDRGMIRPGMAADLVVVDPATVSEQATYADPRRPASGVDDAVVNGVPVLRYGKLTGARGGRPLTPYPGR